MKQSNESKSIKDSLADEKRFKLFFEYLNENEQYKKCYKKCYDFYINNRKNKNVMLFFETLKGKSYFYKTFHAHLAIFGNPEDNINVMYQRYTKGDILPAEKFSLLQKILDTIEFFKPKDDPNYILMNLTVENFIIAMEVLLCRKNDFYIKINIDSDFSLREITSAVRKVVKEERKLRNHQTRERKVGLDELQRYLTVHKTRETIVNGKKQTWPKVYAQLKPGAKFTEEARQKLLSDDRKARSIIRHSIECESPRDFPMT